MNARISSWLVAGTAALAACTGVAWPSVAAATTATSTTTTTTTTTPPASGQLAYFTDTDVYASSGTVRLEVADAGGTNPRELLSNSTRAYGFPVFSPDGQELAYFSAHGTTAQIDVIDLATGTTHVAFTSRAKSAPSAGVAWTSNGDDLVFGTAGRSNGTVASNLALWSVPASGGTATRLTDFDGASDPTLAPDGDIYYVVAKESGKGGSSLWRMEANGAQATKVLAVSYLIALPSVAPTGQEITFTRQYSDTTANIDEVSSSGTDVHALTPKASGRYDALATWSPDGSHLAFLSSRAGRYYEKKSNQLYDGYEMTSSGTDVTKVVAVSGNKAGVDWLTWGS